MTDQPAGQPAPAVDPYDPPLAEVHTDPVPAETPSGNRRLILLVAILAVLLGAGGVVLLVQLWPSAAPSAAPSSAAATPSDSAWPELRALPATLVSSVRSVEDGADTQIAFVNERTDAVVLSWIDENGELSPYATVEAGQTYTQKTYAGHFWSAATSDASVIAVFQATAEPGTALLR